MYRNNELYFLDWEMLNEGEGSGLKNLLTQQYKKKIVH